MKSPKYTKGYIDRHGKPRFYFRRVGFKEMALPGLPWSPEFMAAREHAMAGQPLPIGASKTKPGSMRALAVSYFASVSFRTMKPSTQSVYRNIIERFLQGVTKTGISNGDLPADRLDRIHIVRLMAARSDKPDSANGLRKVLRAMMQHAVETGLRPDDPTRDVKAIRVKTDGYHSWTDDEIAQFEARHPVGSLARLAFALLLCTGQRRGDVVRMGRQHLRDGFIAVKQQKTGAPLLIPVHPDLTDIMAATPSNHLTYLTTAFGKPFTAAGFGNWFRDRCNEAGLPHCSAHGLRKAAARKLAEAGCTEHEIAAITGHRSLREIVRYTRAADQKKLATAAMAKVKTRTTTVYPDGKLDNHGEKR